MIPLIRSIIEKENKIIVIRARGRGGMGSYCLMCIGFQFLMMKSSGNGQW